MATLRELKKNNYDGMYYIRDYVGGDGLKKVHKALEYIEELASKTQTDVGSWDLQAVFNKDENNRACHGDIVTDKRQINKRFFEHREKLEKGPIGFSEEIKKQVENGFARWPKQIDALKQALTDRRRRYTEQTRYAEEAATNYVGLMRALERAEQGDVPNLAENLEAALKEQSFFKFVGIESDYLRFETVADTILIEKNPAAGLDLRVNVGTFVLYIGLNGLTPSIEPLENNIRYNHVFHPHVSNEGDICFGKAQARVLTARAEGDFKTILQMVAHILSSYSPEGGPYVSLQSFHAVSQQTPPNEAWTVTMTADSSAHPQQEAATTSAQANLDRVTRRMVFSTDPGAVNFVPATEDTPAAEIVFDDEGEDDGDGDIPF